MDVNVVLSLYRWGEIIIIIISLYRWGEIIIIIIVLSLYP